MYPSLPKYEVFSEVKRIINEFSFLNIITKSALIKLASYVSRVYVLFAINENFYNQKAY